MSNVVKFYWDTNAQAWRNDHTQDGFTITVETKDAARRLFNGDVVLHFVGEGE